MSDSPGGPASVPGAGGRGAAFGRVVRDAWLIFGLALALLLLLEGAYRAQGAVRGWMRPAPVPQAFSPLHPYAGQAWWRERPSQSGSQRLFRFDPYRTWWKRPGNSAWIHLDSLVRRTTIQYALHSAPARRVLLFGGSTMYGVTARDSFTIPSWLSAELARRGWGDVEVVNYGQIAYNTTQEVITLLLTLRAGNVPDVVVFLDGHNDVAAAYGEGRSGAVLNESRAAQLFERGTPGFWGRLESLGESLALIGRLQKAAHGGSAAGREPPDPVHLCDGVGRDYANLVREAEALGAAWGFRVVFAWQPVLSLTRKPLTPWERSIPRAPYAPMLRRCTAVVDSLLAGRRGRDFLQLASLFDGDTVSVFLDDEAHVTEDANGVIAARLADVIAPLLAARPGSPPGSAVRR